MKNIIFMDIDGTLVKHIDGHDFVPESAKNAISETRKRGNLVYLCTGRSLAEIGDLQNIGFDGMIAGAGCYIATDQVIAHRTFLQQEIEELLRFLNQHQICYYLECNDGLYCLQQAKEFMIREIFHGQSDGDFISLLKPLVNCPLDKVNKISFISLKLSCDEIERQLQEKYQLVRASWGPEFDQAGEISQKGINKAMAMQTLLKHLNLDDIRTFAFGDSMNDREIFESVDVAIAMGNSSHGIEKHATFITKDILDDGIAYAMKKYHLIG